NIEKERPVRRNGFDPAHPSDCVVGNIHCEMVVRVSRGRDQVPVLVKDRIPVIHVATIETIEIVEAETVGPPGEWTGAACLPNRRVVVLADPSGHVTVLAKDFADGPSASR